MEVSGQRNGRSFKDSVGKSSAEDNEVFCHPCNSEGDWVVAVGYCQNCNEYFCAACLKPHRKQSMSKHHIILEGDLMPRPKMSQLQLDPCSEPCNQHTNEIVKFHCSSHDAVGCSDCMVLDHKTCQVDRIQDISSKFIDSQEHKELIGKVDKFLNDLDKLRHQVQRNKQNINDAYNKAVNDIKAFREEVNDYFDKVEAEILTEVNSTKESDENIMSKLEAEKQSLQNEMKVIEEKLNQQSNKANELFVAAKKMKDRMSSLDTTLREMFQKSQVKQYRFEPSSEIRQIFTSKIPLGKLTNNLDENLPLKMNDVVPQHFPLRKLTEDADQNRSQRNIVDMLPLFDGDINVRAAEDIGTCLLLSPVMISPTQIVVVDNSNECVKLVDIGQRKLLARYGFNTNPTDVTRVSENTIAVTLPKEQKIQFLSITPEDIFTLGQEMKVNCECKKLFCVQDQIFIACVGKIKILNTSGNAVKEITLPDLILPKCIAPANDFKSFFVSNCQYEGKPTVVYKLNFDGSLVATYKDNKLPYVAGLAVTRDGTVLVCNWSDSASIHVLSSECKKIKEILQHNRHVIRPYCVSYCDETKKLFVCNSLVLRSKDNLNDVLKIFQMY